MPKSSTLLLKSSGRPIYLDHRPWYSSNGKNHEVYVIGVAGKYNLPTAQGGSASGKTSVARHITKNLGVPWVVIISTDSFYNVLTPEQSKRAFESNYNFDHPDSFDHGLMVEAIKKLKKGLATDIPVYDFSTHSRSPETQRVYGATVIIFEGIFALYYPKLLELMDMKIFVDTDSDICLARRIRRDISERARSPEGILDQYKRFVKPMFDEFVKPTMGNADVIIPRGMDNTVAIDLITKHIQRQLKARELDMMKHSLVRRFSKLSTLPDSLIVMKQTPQLKAIHTIIRDKDVPRSDFVFYSDRISRLVIERGLAELPLTPHAFTTPTNRSYDGFISPQYICGVPMLRAGGVMEKALRQVIKTAVFGKVLIVADPKVGEPRLHYVSLPKGIPKYYVFMMDATLATGASALMAIRAVLDHGVPEDHIIFLAILAAPEGINAVNNAFPKVRIVTSMVDPCLSKSSLTISPGFGEFSGKYFLN
ncbi:Uridine kinase [Mycoemilia scoparia]|uniref:Uridine kinase n=1 Tax=Mycoemilia scoparia TaxID=417184 RepID=A0A9W8A3Q7_9FUNG|nr:Uridine kinase [Mycoemilia scoparia]